MQILPRILSSWIMVSLQELCSRGSNKVWKKQTSLAPSDSRVYANSLAFSESKIICLKPHSAAWVIRALFLLRSLCWSGSGPAPALPGLLASFVLPFEPDLLFLFLIWICLAFREASKLPSVFRDEGIHPTEAIRGFTQKKELFLSVGDSVLSHSSLRALSWVCHTCGQRSLPHSQRLRSSFLWPLP